MNFLYIEAKFINVKIGQFGTIFLLPVSFDTGSVCSRLVGC